MTSPTTTADDSGSGPGYTAAIIYTAQPQSRGDHRITTRRTTDDDHRSRELAGGTICKDPNSQQMQEHVERFEAALADYTNASTCRKTAMVVARKIHMRCADHRHHASAQYLGLPSETALWKCLRDGDGFFIAPGGSGGGGAHTVEEALYL